MLRRSTRIVAMRSASQVSGMPCAVCREGFLSECNELSGLRVALDGCVEIEGGVVQGLGQALMEDYQLENGHTKTHGFAKYILPTALDIPQINVSIVEDRDPRSPLGAKGIGDPSLIPTAPAIMNAIYDAVGVRITALPATPEKILAALGQGKLRGQNLFRRRR